MTYLSIQKKFKRLTGRTCKGCWIADRKNHLEFTTKPSPNRGLDYPKWPCPKEYISILDPLIIKDQNS